MIESRAMVSARRTGGRIIRRGVGAARRRGRWGWLGLGLCAAGLLEVPWIFVLAATLPNSQFPATWIGLDICEAIGLMATGLGLLRRDPRGALAAAVTATLLALDAWFDVTTATSGADRLAALAMAFGAEIPIAAACVAVAVHLSAMSATPRGSDETPDRGGRAAGRSADVERATVATGSEPRRRRVSPRATRPRRAEAASREQALRAGHLVALPRSP